MNSIDTKEKGIDIWTIIFKKSKGYILKKKGRRKRNSGK